MNETQQEMLESAKLLHVYAVELVKAVKARNYRAVSDSAAIAGQAMYELSRMALLAELERED